VSLIEAFTELESLLSQALRSPDEVTEIERGESTWKMHRNPSRGRSIELTEFRSTWDSVFQAPDADEARGARFRGLVADCEGAGWKEVGKAEPEVPLHAAGVCLERRGIRRELHSIALGPIQILVLREQSH
jgi:hypothetical protein